MDDRLVGLLREDIQALREEVQELRNEFQRAKGAIVLVKWLAGIGIALVGLWYKLHGGAG